MFEGLIEVARDLRAEMLSVYWTMLTPVTLILICLELLKSEMDRIGALGILRRVVISILLILSFDMTTDFIGGIGDSFLEKLEKYNDSWEAFKNLGPKLEKSDKWFDVREYIIFAIALISYLVAYLGFFMAEALTHFIWIILYICSPMMILCYVPVQTSQVTFSLYRGLIKVVVWKVLWSILGALLLKLALNPNLTGMEDYLFSMVLNLSIGVSMLFIPIATKSLINEGLQSAGAAISAIPTGVVAKIAKVKMAGMGRGTLSKARKIRNNARSRFGNNQRS